MAILIANDGDKTVNTIAERDAIEKKFNGMQVTVVDAIADILVGMGTAGYIWSSSKNRWQLFWKESKDDLLFVTESHFLINGEITLDNIPQSNLVWDCSIVDANGVTLIDVSSPNVTNTTVNIGSLDYDGNVLLTTYAYGKIQAAVSAAIDFNHSSFYDFQLTVPVPTTVLLDALPINKVGTINYLIQAQSGSLFHSTQVLVIHDGVTPTMNETNTVFTSDNLIDLSCDIVGNVLQLYATTYFANTVATSIRTLIRR